MLAGEGLEPVEVEVLLLDRVLNAGLAQVLEQYTTRRRFNSGRPDCFGARPCVPAGRFGRAAVTSGSASSQVQQERQPFVHRPGFVD